MILGSEADTERVGSLLAKQLRAGDVVTLTGPLGVGKTALVRALLHASGHLGEVPSPSFAIVQPYDDLALPIWHADLYRLEHPSELEELGLDVPLSDGCLIVEWPERAGDRAWPDALRLFIDFAPDGARSLTAKVPTAWEERWPLR